MAKQIILQTDSYKLRHWPMYPEGTEVVHSYFESRAGARFPFTQWFGLQAIIKQNLVGQVVTREKIEQAARLCKAHFGDEKAFNRKGWEHILEKHGGKLPVIIKAVPEGTCVPTGNVLMTVENTDPACYWLTNALESLLTHVWYSSTVATLSRTVKLTIKKYLAETSENLGGLNFMLHDFGYRGVSSDESAEIGGAAHLTNFLGTDTVPAILFIDEFYGGNGSYDGIAYSVAATEHSIMTSLGKDGEEKLVAKLLDDHVEGILSVVADSYDIYYFVAHIVGKAFKDRILARNGVFVVRPDSISAMHPSPESQMVWIVDSLMNSFGYTENAKGFRVLPKQIRVLWGDGINDEGIEKILEALKLNKFSAENIATFGMGGGLLQKVNRDTQRFAFKSSAQKRNGVWYDVFKEPKDPSKASKKGKLKLVRVEGAHGSTLITVPISDPRPDELVTVFENGKLVKEYSFAEIRETAERTSYGY